MPRQSINNDIDFEIQFYEGILKKNPDFVEALNALGGLYTKKGLYEKGLRVDERLVQLKPEDPFGFYNLSCSYSLLNNVEQSFGSIKKAIDSGYCNFKYLEQDSDLLNLRRDSRFQQYYLRIKEQVQSS